MVEHELLRLPERLLSRVRLFSGAADVALPLRRVLMPYDGRLNGANSALPGTGTDFAARALADFTRWILPELPDADLEAHRGAVVRRLSSWAYNSRLIRERHTDEQLSALITEHWNDAGFSASRMLRYFRDELGIACEQARFARLFARAQVRGGDSAVTYGSEMLIVRAVKTTQGDGVDVFSFFLYGSDIVRVADISRIVRDEGELKGFQRKEIRSHVNSIVEFLDSGPVLFPNAIILALSPEVEFKYSRGSRPEGFVDVAELGDACNSGPGRRPACRMDRGRTAALTRLGPGEGQSNSRARHRLCVG